jgi:hypothetical protein
MGQSPSIPKAYRNGLFQLLEPIPLKFGVLQEEETILELLEAKVQE